MSYVANGYRQMCQNSTCVSDYGFVMFYVFPGLCLLRLFEIIQSAI